MNSNQGLNSGRDWGAVPLRQNQHEWTMEADGPMVQGPLDMEFLRGQRISLVLDEGQYGLMVRKNILKAVYLDGAHYLDIGSSPGQIPTDSHLFFLSTDQAIHFSWGKKHQEVITTQSGTSVICQCSVRIEKPARFYHRTLRELNQWDPETIENHLKPLVSEALRSLLDQICEHSHHHDASLQSNLMALSPSQLDEFLTDHGLYCESLAAYTASGPVENYEDLRAGQTTDLLHN